MRDKHRISGKDLGALALAEFCPRCFWLERHSPHGLPYEGGFPGIFSSIDSYSKHLVHGWFDRHGGAPPWLAPLGDVTGYIEPPHHSKFRMHDPASGLTLTGAPDALFTRQDGSILIGDYKTARFTPAQDALLPLYTIQLNAYAMIAEDLGMGPVSGLALIYTEPVTAPEVARSDAVVRDEGFAMGFSAHILAVPIDPAQVRRLLARARAILDHLDPPPSRPECEDCRRLADVTSLGDGRVRPE